MWHMTQADPQQTPDVEPALLPIKHAATILGLSAWTTYKLCDQGRLESVYQGARRYVVAASIPTYIDSLSSTPSA
jgi:hypothetical protein